LVTIEQGGIELQVRRVEEELLMHERFQKSKVFSHLEEKRRRNTRPRREKRMVDWKKWLVNP
jgi:hypothetical protein